MDISLENLIPSQASALKSVYLKQKEEPAPDAFFSSSDMISMERLLNQMPKLGSRRRHRIRSSGMIIRVFRLSDEGMDACESFFGLARR